MKSHQDISSHHQLHYQTSTDLSALFSGSFNLPKSKQLEGSKQGSADLSLTGGLATGSKNTNNDIQQTNSNKNGKTDQISSSNNSNTNSVGNNQQANQSSNPPSDSSSSATGQSSNPPSDSAKTSSLTVTDSSSNPPSDSSSSATGQSSNPPSDSANTSSSTATGPQASQNTNSPALNSKLSSIFDLNEGFPLKLNSGLSPKELSNSSASTSAPSNSPTNESLALNSTLGSLFNSNGAIPLNFNSANSQKEPPGLDLSGLSLRVSSESKQKSDNSSKEGLIFGIIPLPDFLIGIGVAIFLIILIYIIVKCYRRYKANKQYNQNPEYFSKKPDLGFIMEGKFNKAALEPLVAKPENVQTKLVDGFNGRYYEVTFNGPESSLLCYHRRQDNTRGYFQIEIVQLNSRIGIGYILKEEFEKVKNLQEFDESKFNVIFDTSGLTTVEGDSVFNYNLSLGYGDIIGIGLTKEQSDTDRRAWVSKNGQLLNPPPASELDKWIAISKAQGGVETSTKHKAEEEKKKTLATEQEEKDDPEKKQKQAKEKQLQKKRLILPNLRSFNYYPIIANFVNGPDQNDTIINVNVGAQTFRMYGQHFNGGLLG